MNVQSNPGFVERRFRAQDDIEIYYRDYGDPNSPRVPLLCLSGLTRNSKDFHQFALHHAPHRRVLAMDYRGRGRSAYDPNWRNYHPRTYVTDVMTLLTVANVHRAVFMGTSLGGIVTMAMGAAMPSAVAGAILNDVGPELNTAGLSRIAGYVGADVRLPNFQAAAQALRIQFLNASPDLSEEGWLRFAQNVFVEDPARGDVRLDYDLNLALPFKEQSGADGKQPDMWALFHSLREIPLLAIRGALSDLLSADVFKRMAVDMPNLVQAEIPNRGHVPLLDEPECEAAIDAFLARF